ncbi:hypothetical protein GCM10010282_31220 [Streptomyces roseolus]|nr:hypothetical protein GCM10010282_31220 [Streptomyces roseolus]
MKELEGCGGDHPRFDELVMKLMTQIRSHVNDEENNLFPCLRQGRFAETLEKLGDKVRQAEKTAPARPHPSAPDKPPADKLPGPGGGLVDPLRDAMSGRAKNLPESAGTSFSVRPAAPAGQVPPA